MAELKRLRVREAQSRDIGLFRKLWTELLNAQRGQGSVTQASEKTMVLYEALFNTYVENHLEGVVLFVADKGVLMWGENTSIEYDDKTLIAWGDFGSAVEGVKEALIERAEEWAIEHEYKGILRQSFGTVVPSKGYKEIGTLLFKTLSNG